VLSRYTRAATPMRRTIARVGRPLCTVVDRPMGAVRELRTSVADPAPVRSRPLPTSELLELIAEVSRPRRLRPRYDERSLGRVLDVWRRARHRGSFTQRVVESADGMPLGWYIGHIQRDGTSEIVQIGARDGSEVPVFGCMLFDCKSRGSALVQGRADTTLLRPAIANDCFFRPTAWMLAHARDAEIHDALAREDVFLSALENERPW
jgi:hypothetical protein